jgi:hypothetical protein
MSRRVVSVRKAYLDSEASLCCTLTVNKSTLVFFVRVISSRAQNWLDGPSLIAPDACPGLCHKYPPSAWRRRRLVHTGHAVDVVAAVKATEVMIQKD